MHQALYRKWRPSNFDEVSGQEHITSILKYQCQTGKFSHAYLFCGSRGTGKTSCAKILSKAVNCEHPTEAGPCGQCASCRAIDAGSATDVLEMDAASNNGVDDIRDIRDEVIYAPSELKYRVYIIDEVHMLSTSAFNALLKTLEEPPEHVVFVLATTELQKLPATIISRCQRFDFRRISTEALSARLHLIARAEGFTLEDEAARLIARHAQGGMRDAISLLELCAGNHLPITADLVTDTIGSAGREGMLRVATAVADRDYETLFSMVDETVRSSRDLAVFWQDLITLYRDMLVLKTTKNAVKYLDLTDSEQAAMTQVAARFTRETLLWHVGLLEDALFSMQKSHSIKRTVAEITLIRLCDPLLDTSTESILSRLSKLEEAALTGTPVARPAPVAAPVAPAIPVADPDEFPPEPYFGDEPVCEPHIPMTSTLPKTAPVAPAKPVNAPEKKPVFPVGVEQNRRILRPLRAWSEVVARVGERNPMVAPFFKQAKAYTTEDGKVIIKFGNEFALGMTKKGDIPETLRAALAVALGRPISPDDVLTEVENDTKASPDSMLDLILEAAEE
ncbi:MAG: DNA polymerase III subunit gamma/tau [Clostridia bacterium]|nr:DNA polymerase III subunit gamma/tau [Clostridia bacterium]